MTSTRSLLYWFLLPFLCLCFASACKSKGAASTPRSQPRAEEPFKGEPKVTADVHYMSGQLHESRIPAANDGKAASQAEVTRLQVAALNQYAAALKLEPDHAPSLYRSAVLLSGMKRHEQALAMWERYVAAVGRTPDSLVNLGIASEFAGQPQKAEAAYREATRLDKAHKSAHVNLGILLAKQGQLQPAQATLSSVLEPAAVHWHMGVALLAAGREREADQQFRAAAALDPAYAKRPRVPASTSARVE